MGYFARAGNADPWKGNRQIRSVGGAGYWSNTVSRINGSLSAYYLYVITIGLAPDVATAQMIAFPLRCLMLLG